MNRGPFGSPAVGSRARLTGTAIVNGGGGGTKLGAPLQTRTVIGLEEENTIPTRATPATPNKNRSTAASSSSSSSSSTAFGRATPTRSTPSKLSSSAAGTPVRQPASSPIASAASAVASSSSATSSTPVKMISRQRYDSNKASDPFTSKTKFKSSFSEAYVNGRIPCRINHGSVRHQLQWDQPSHELNYDYLLPIIADGLIETDHPHVVIVRQAWVELLNEGGQARVAPVLTRLIHPIRRALMDAAPGVFQAACDALIALAATVGPLLNPHLDLIVQQVNKKSLNGKMASKVNDTLMAFAEHGGDEAVTMIKKRVPAFTFQ